MNIINNIKEDNTMNTIPEIFFIMEDNELRGFYLNFEDAMKVVLDRVNEFCDQFIEDVENGWYEIDEMQEELLLNDNYCDLSINTMSFKNGICNVFSFDGSYPKLDTEHSYYWSDLESCCELVVNRQRNYKEEHKK